MSARAAIYTRNAFRAGIVTIGCSIAGQLATCRKVISENDFTVVAEIQDDGARGATLQRSGLAQLNMLVEHGDVDAVVVFTGDRLATRHEDRACLVRDWLNHGAKLLVCSWSST